MWFFLSLYVCVHVFLAVALSFACHFFTFCRCFFLSEYLSFLTRSLFWVCLAVFNSFLTVRCFFLSVDISVVLSFFGGFLLCLFCLFVVISFILSAYMYVCVCLSVCLCLSFFPSIFGGFLELSLLRCYLFRFFRSFRV